jgi:hypothetical protein
VDSTSAPLIGRMRGRVWCQRPDRTSTSAAGICAASYAAAATRSQSIQSRYCASTALHPHHAYSTKRNPFNAKHRSKW